MTAGQRQDLLGALAIVALAALTLWAMGRTIICTCGTVKLWHGVVFSSENSQHLTDWYSISHIVHGLIFYALAGLVRPAAGWSCRLLLAVLVESVWEVLENTDYVIQRYREATIALDYFGDSIVNSLVDILAMVAGVAIAAAAPAGVSIATAIGLELFLLFAIRDNVTLNLIMLLHPLDAIRAWQGGG